MTITITGMRDNRLRPLRTQPMDSNEAVDLQEESNELRGMLGVYDVELTAAPQYRYLTQGRADWVTPLGVAPVDRD